MKIDEAERILRQRIPLGKELLGHPIENYEELGHLETQARIWHDFNLEWIRKYLPPSVWIGYPSFIEHSRIAGLDFSSDMFRADIKKEITIIESIIQRLPLWAAEPKEEAEPERESPSPESARGPALDAPVFIVHGSDTIRAQLVARAVERATKREVVILREQPNGGRTLIEKFEDNAQKASYAIVLITADDIGGRIAGPSSPRGRQNVIFEMGYFYGQIGRHNVCVLLDPGVEPPSDMSGIVYINFGNDSAWKQELFREMQHAGFTIDWSRIPS